MKGQGGEGREVSNGRSQPSPTDWASPQLLGAVCLIVLLEVKGSHPDAPISLQLGDAPGRMSSTGAGQAPGA